MRRKSFFFLLLILLFSLSPDSFAFWVWTPETNKWVNPKYAVKETPAEQLQYAIEFYDAREYKKAMGELEKLIKHYPRSREAPEAQFYIGLCWEALEKPLKAFKNYQMVIDKYPFSERSAQIVEKEYDIGMKLLEDERSRSKFMDSFIGADYDIVEVFRSVIKNAPYGELAPSAQYKIGLYLLEHGLYQEARDEFEKTVNDYPNSKWAKAAKYQMAITDAERSAGAQYDQKITQAASEEFEEFVKTYPAADLSEKAKKQIQELKDKEAENNFVIAQFYEKQKNYKAARIYYQTVVDEYGNSRWAAKALKKIRELSAKE